MNLFSMHLLSFNGHDLQVLSFDGATESLRIPFTAFESFVYKFFCFSLTSILSSTPEILSSTCFSLLEFPVFFIWFKELFISRVSVWFFFWRFPYLC
jgi:hypothetical protein